MLKKVVVVKRSTPLVTANFSTLTFLFLAVVGKRNNVFSLSSCSNRNMVSSSLLDTNVLATEANSFASANGIQVERRKNIEEYEPLNRIISYEGAPMSLLPNAFPEREFKKACDVAPAFNELVDRVSRDIFFLEQTLGGGVSEMDSFTATILDLYRKVYVNNDNDNAPAKIADRLGIHRSDYMLHRNPATESDDDIADNGSSYQLKQVELNTIASSFAGLSCKIADMHRFLVSRYEKETEEFLQTNRKRVMMTNDNSGGGGEASQLRIPTNPALDELPLAMKVAYDRYIKRFLDNETKENTTPVTPVVLFVVQDGETNTVDQRLLEFSLWESYKVPVIRRSLKNLYSELFIDETDGALYLLNPTKEEDLSKAGYDKKERKTEIAVIYFRAGYAPMDYGSENGIEWKARLTLENSRATKCPCLGYHLAGTKKVQQELARPGVLERFFPGKDEVDKVNKMRACFAGLYSCGDDATPEDMKALKEALDGGYDKYVLKPQREGGGYNFYGKNLCDKLRENTSRSGDNLELTKDLAEYILMQRLFPPEQTAVLLRGGVVEGVNNSVSELGAYGTLVVDSNGSVIHNRYAGFLLRTKFSNVDEGGVASGFATLSSPYLC